MGCSIAYLVGELGRDRVRAHVAVPGLQDERKQVERSRDARGPAGTARELGQGGRAAVTDDRAVLGAVAGVGHQLAVAHPSGPLARPVGREDRDQRPDLPAVGGQPEVLAAGVADRFRRCQGATVAHGQRAPIELADAAGVMVPREPRANGQLVAGMGVRAAPVDLGVDGLQPLLPCLWRHVGLLPILLEEVAHLVELRRCAHRRGDGRRVLDEGEPVNGTSLRRQHRVQVASHVR